MKLTTQLMILLLAAGFLFNMKAIDNKDAVGVHEEKRMLRIAINGFGRIGRNFLRGILLDAKARENIEVVAINIGPARLDFVDHMLKYDTLMGTFPADVRVDGDELVVDDYRIKLLAELDPCKLPWSQLNIDWVVECSGCFTHRQGAQKHLEAGAKHVLISAPAKNEDVAIIPGVNSEWFDSEKHKIVSMGSCTTNAFMTMLKVLHDTFGIKRGFMTTVHSYTNTQVLLDVDDGDLRRSRAAALNIIPTTTGAAKMLSKVIPDLDGKVFAMAIRVPVGKVSLIDLTFETEKELTVEAMHIAFKSAAADEMKGILSMTMEPLVSSDFSGNDYSVTVDGLLTQANGNMGKVFGWYDNEWGYSMRMKDFLLNVAKS